MTDETAPESTPPPSPPPSTLVYLDVDDEITSAAARIRAAGADRVALVLPYGSRLATSRINFRLLAREATERGKQIEIICADSSARALALAAGLPVHPSVASFEGRAPVAKAPGGASGADRDESVGGATAAAVIGGAEADDPDVADDTQTRVLTVPRRSSPRVPIVGPPRPPMRPRIAVALGVAVVALVLVAGFLAVEVLPSATIVLHPRSEAIGPLDFTVEARADATAPDAAALVIPARRVTFELQASDAFTATGVKTIDTKATGNVTFTNYDTSRANQIAAGSVVKTESGIEFITLATVTLPRAPILSSSTSSVGVEAVVAGPGGNIGSDMIIVVPKGENAYLLDVTNREAITGGEDRQATQVSATDVETAKAAIGTALADQLNQQLAAGAGVPPALTMFPATAAVGEPDYAVDPASLVGTEATEFDLSATAEGTVLGVDPTPIRAISESRLESQVKAGWTLVATATRPTMGTPSAFGEIVTYPVTIIGAQLHDVDQVALLGSIKGLGLADARARLTAYGDVEITLWPDWVSKVPTNADRITFTLGDPQPSATP